MPTPNTGAAPAAAAVLHATARLSEAGDGTTISFAVESGGGDGTGATAIAPTATQPGPPCSGASESNPRDPLYPVPPPMDTESPKPGTREKVRLASLPSKEKLAMVLSADAADGTARSTVDPADTSAANGLSAAE